MDPEVLSHYYVLEVEHDARDVQIKLGYRRQSLKWHPDKNPHASLQRRQLCHAMMVKLNDAYKCLRDPDARKLYELRCASIVFTHPDDPGNWFREQFEAERRAREREAQRQRNEERERNAARQREREEQERRRREAEERQQRRREAEERERQQRAERERQAAEERTERERQEQERRSREQRQQEQSQRRYGSQEHQAGAGESNRSANSNFTGQEWETFFNIIRVLIMLHEITSENRRQNPGSFSGSFGGSSRTSNDGTADSSFGGSATSNGGPPRPSSSEPRPEAPRATQDETNDNFATGSTFTEPPNFSYQRRRQPGFGAVHGHSSGARWSQTEFEALLKLRRDYPYERWDTIACRLNNKFGNGRNGSAVRQKHNRHCR
ncbi:hypothetical protein TWF481_000226 [Arthrobotrys musiformis]|uniref:J domain-containing protein n=1 Tax=Arthrobotrys musiformis TaxID=47236 RepID=A0AAV9WM03_9PEZI